MYTKTTQLIKVNAIPIFLEQQSSPEDAHYVWAYTIQIENHSEETVQLLNRVWHITDGMGQQQEVKGPGVVGEQPILEPGDHYQYTSGTVLPTPSGLMSGSYEMVNVKTAERFDVEIPAFSLDSPDQAARPN